MRRCVEWPHGRRRAGRGSRPSAGCPAGEPLGSHAGCRARAKDRLGDRAGRPTATLIAAAYVHDIGYAPELEDTASIRSMGRAGSASRGQERLACLVAHHSGARFEAEDRGLLDALDEFPEERSVVADLLTYCDLTTDPDGQRGHALGASRRDRQPVRRRQRRVSEHAGCIWIRSPR